jgi:hypothetical protein
MKRYYDETQYVRMPKKVKHVHFVKAMDVINLERDVNGFADEHPEYKILGVKLTVAEGTYIATVTYLCDAEGEGYSNDYESDYDEE